MFHAVRTMSTVSKGHNSGSATGLTSPSRDLKQKAPPKPVTPPQPQSLPLSSDGSDSRVTFHAGGGVWLRGIPLSIARHAVVFEMYNPQVNPQLSESLGEFKIIRQDRTVYAGHAVIRNIVDAGTKLICEAALDETAWARTATTAGAAEAVKADLKKDFNKFVSEWQKSFRVLPEYKLIIADLLTFLSDLRLWLDQIESGIRSAPVAQQAKLEIEAVDQLRGPVIASLNNMFEPFEILAGKIPKDLQASHRSYGQRILHPYLLCAPFINRCYTKPLGYAGDYEMMNMIVRNKLEGGSLYAKLVNQYLLDQIGPMAVRGRVDFLHGKIVAETSRVSLTGRKAKIFCIACGPAWEAVNFIADHPLADKADFRFLDFNEETLRYTTGKVNEVKRLNHRKTTVEFVRNSIQNLLRGKDTKPEFDLIYCSGLYDYLSDSVILAANTNLYDRLNPGGRLVVGNFAPALPVINFIEHFLEWFLIYRNSQEMLALSPSQASKDDCMVRAEPTGTNIFLEAYKPE
ncbi:MAG TPA: class I SAM-dependent methyltransferase [Candidatus Acidoferrales bacterium]|nr:class I SAM-dependent methyltransferase [Candidatus Acidoferrales bacterium]